MVHLEDVFRLKHNATAAHGTMQQFAGQMVERAKSTVFCDAGVTVAQADGKDVLFMITTPTSAGRVRHTWAGSPKDLIGVLTVERVQLDKYDRERWDTVLSIGLHQSGLTTFHSTLEGLVDPQVEGGGEAGRDPYWVALMLTVYYLSRFSDLR